MMRLQVLFDKRVADDRYQGGWGLSYLLDGTFLFDTGEKFEYLEHNAQVMGVDLDKIKEIFITHDHWDHTGGMQQLLARNRGCTVYGCPGFSEEFRQKVTGSGGRLTELGSMTKLRGGLYSTGEIVADYKGMRLPEQGLVIEREEGLVLLSGCAHPGIVTMVDEVNREFTKHVVRVIGGLHLLEQENRYVGLVIDQLKERGVTQVGAAHCTGFDPQVLFRQAFGDDFIDVRIGSEIVF